MLMACTFDTNILVYTLPNPANTKREQARSLLIRGARDSANVLLLQALAEFSYVAARKFALNAASIRHRVDDWRAAMAFLQRRFPDRWQKRQATEITGKNGGPIKTESETQLDLKRLSDDELSRRSRR